MGSLNIPKESEVIVLSSDEDEDFRKLIKMTSPIKFGKSPSPDVDNEQGDLIVLSSEDELPDLNPRVIEPLIKNHVPETLRIAEPSHSQPSCSTNVRTASRSPPTATKTMDTTDEVISLVLLFSWKRTSRKILLISILYSSKLSKRMIKFLCYLNLMTSSQKYTATYTKETQWKCYLMRSIS